MSKEDTKKDKEQTGDDRSPQVGALLKASRLRIGEDLRDVSDDLCIRYLYLEAIEECRYEALPGDTYAVGFIRTYAEHLGLAGEEVVRRYRAEQAGKRNASDLSFPTPVQDSGVPKGALVFVGALLAILVYGGWYMTTSEDSILSDIISPVPDHLKHLAGDDKDAPEAPAQPDQQSASATTSEPTTPKPEAIEAKVKEVVEKAENAVDTVLAEGQQVAETATSEVASAAETAEATVEQAVDTASETVAETANAAQQQVSEAASDAATAAGNAVETVRDAVSETVTSEAASPSTEPVVAADGATDTPAPTSTSDAVTTAVTEVAEETTREAREASAVTAEQLNASALEEAASGATPATQNAPAQSSAETSGGNTEQAAVPSSGIVITASSRSWVEIRNTENGDIFYTGLLAPGKSIEVPDDGALLLDTGNAGALNISVDGDLVPSIGSIGDVRKNVALNAARLKAGTATNQ